MQAMIENHVYNTQNDRLNIHYHVTFNLIQYNIL